MVNNNNLDKAEKQLRNIAELCIDGIIGYKEAASGVDNDKLKILFSNFAKEREEIFQRFNTEIISIGGKPIDEKKSFGTVQGSINEFWFSLKSKVVEDKFDNIIKACEHNEKTLLSKLNEFLEDKNDMPSGSVYMVESAYKVINKRLNMLKQAEDFYHDNENDSY